ncbi:MAG: hypothetical protein ABTQ29_13050 [Siculibacillus sp.]
MQPITTITRTRGAIRFTRPVDGTLRLAVAVLGLGVAIGALVPVAMLRPGLAPFPDTFVWMTCGAGLALGSLMMAIGAWGIERTVAFQASSASILEEVRTFSGLTVRRRLGYEECGTLGAVREDRPDGRATWHLFLVDGGDGAAVEIADFGSEEEMRGTVAQIAAIRPDFALG